MSLPSAQPPPPPTSSRSSSPATIVADYVDQSEKANFPSLFCPLFHHDIRQSIRPKFQSLVFQSYNGWRFVIVGLNSVLLMLSAANVVLGILLMILIRLEMTSPSQSPKCLIFLGGFSLSYFVWSLFYFLLICCSSLVLVHFPLYWAIKSSSQIYLIVFTVFAAAYLLFLAIELVSVSTVAFYPGAVLNLKSLMDLADNGKVAGTIIAAIGFVLELMQFSFYSIFVFKVHRRLKWELQ